MLFRFIILLIVLFSLNITGQNSYYKVSCPALNGDEGKDYALDTLNFKAYLVSETGTNWKIYKVDLLTGTTASLNIVANGPINSLYYRNDSLYFGGTFTVVNSNAINYKYFGVYNVASNNLLPNCNLLLNGPVTAITIHKNRLFIGGQFNSVLGNTTDYLNIVCLEINGFSFNIPTTNFSFPADLTGFIISQSKITKMKTFGNYLFFIIDDVALYNFEPFPLVPIGFIHKAFIGSGDPAVSKIYDYELVNGKVYLVGNFQVIQTGFDINNLTNIISAGSDFDKIIFYDLFSGTFSNYFSNVSALFPLTSNNVPPMNVGIQFGCSGISYRKNRFNLVLNRTNYTSNDLNTVVNTDSGIANLSQVQYASSSYIPLTSSSPFGNYFTLNNSKNFSNIVTVFEGKIGKYNTTYSFSSVINDSLLIMRFGNAVINGKLQSLGNVCKGDTFSVKLNKQGNLHGYQWSYSGSGITIISSNSDSARVVFNYGATSGNLKVYAYDNFNYVTDTLIYPIIFNPIPNINAGANKYITCKNSSVNLSATTSLTNYYMDWITPVGLNTSSSLVNITSPGTYYARILDNTTGCYGYDTVVVSVDLVKPNVSFATSNNYTLTCKQNTQTIIANTVNPLDSIYWNSIGIRYASTASFIATNSGKKFVTSIGNFNGCTKLDSITIFQNVVLPPISNNVIKDSLTCLRDSVLLDGSSSLGKVLFWKRPGFPNDSLSDPIHAKLFGAYSLIVRDTSTGCKSTLIIPIVNKKLDPYVNLPSNSAVISCSQNTISLNGSSATANTVLNWIGPSLFSSTNPAVINSIGVYTITATDTINGCKKTDTVLVTQQNSLLLQSTSDTTICNGSTLTLSSLPIGGTLPYSYTWQGNGNASQITVSPIDTTRYPVTIVDANGCVGYDTVTVFVPSVLQDSTKTFQPCDPNNPNGQIQIYPKGGTAPFVYSLNGSPYQSSNVFANLGLGTYSLSIKDALGCIKNGITQINNSSLSPQNDFLVSTNLFKVDTFVVVDISNPKPDSVQWNFPSTFTVINITNPYAPIVICSDTGYYTIQQTAYFGSCAPVLTKTVHIKYNDGSFATAYNNNGIQSVGLSPNPNDGQFNLTVSMYKKQNFTIFVNDATGVEKHRISVTDSDLFSGNISVPNITNGTYVLKVVSAYDSKHILFIVTQ